MSEIQQAKALVLSYFKDMETCKPDECEAVLSKYMTEDCMWEGSYPFMFQHGPKAVAETFWKPVKTSLHSMQRRMDVFMAGKCEENGKIWVNSMGQLMGNYCEELLNVRVTGKMQHLWYCEYNCVENGKITDSAIFVDLLGFMREAGDDPMPFETGHFFAYPGPRDHNGLLFDEQPKEWEEETHKAVYDMIDDLEALSASGSFGTVPIENMRAYWGEDMIWYGPCGVGASFTIETYLKQHTGPFRRYLDKKGPMLPESCFIKKDIPDFEKRGMLMKAAITEGHFHSFYGNMTVTPIGGWLGMTAGKKDVPLRADLDIYYVKDGKISENWCYFDVPYFLKCQGFDIFERTASIVNPK